MKKQQLTTVLLAVILVVLIAVAVVAYGSMSEKYEEDVLGTTAEVTTTVATTVATTTEPAIETTADFIMTDKDKNNVRLSDFFGKPIVVNFWATWCSPCTSEMPHFEEAYKEYGDEVTFLMVNVGDSTAKAYEYAKENGYTFPVFHDSAYSASYAYGVSSIPKTLFINARGELVSSRVGMMNKATLIKAIESIK